MAAHLSESSSHLATRGSLPDDNNELLLWLNRTKRLDMKTSVEIAGIANCSVRDLNGNLLPFVWTRHSVCNEFENATLLTREALQKHLQTFIEAGVKENIDLLQKVNDPALLVDWVVRTAEHWEVRYAEKRNEKYDISQPVISAMFEAVFDTAWPMMIECLELDNYESLLQKKLEELAEKPDSNKYHQQLMQYISEHASKDERKLGSFFWLHRGSNALVRLLYRTDCVSGLREHLCMLAGKMLQKKEVCNKAGAYASHRQRSDVLQEWYYAVRDFRTWVDRQNAALTEALQRIFEQEEWIFLVIDHTAVPLTLLPLRSPVIPFAQQSTMCQHCQATIDSNKRRRESGQHVEGT
jgi:hypothetical protein